MDVLTHTLAGLLLARLMAAPGLTGARAACIAVACANLPELEQLLRLSSTQDFLLHRGGATHSLLFLLVAPLLVVAPLRRLRDPASPAPAPWAPALWLGMLATGFHVGMGALTAHGAALLWPMRAHRYALDWLFPGDPVPALLCLAALAAPWLGASPRRAPVAGIMALGFYAGLMGGAHGVARNQAAAMARKEGFDADATYAFPEAPGGLFWNTVAANEAEVLQRPVDLFRPARAGFRYYRGLEEPLVEDFLERTPLGQAWSARARVVVASSDRSGTAGAAMQGWEVWARDLSWFSRFDAPERVTPYDVRARFDADATLQEAQLFMPSHLPDEPPPFPVRGRTPAHASSTVTHGR